MSIIDMGLFVCLIAHGSREMAHSEICNQKYLLFS